ncbi:hypothetical protein PCYB_082050 [Plasmodium cynomolgi strain B]|uniref:Dolichyl-phosphate-mannose protein mannosyltransferase n=1 Tax=Plasmodium cynomolgi (strain B) TaxID=1120755 RepID=K6US99_PLACD|nr:hypothetical protein PCYB_082050 [Plasmodium cynomolgi strain B]GAB66044.1 hypothetical protein PCYB_082050 [Plasmodium cynomolgi strain B]
MSYHRFFVGVFLISFLFFKVHSCLYVTDGSSIILENVGTSYKLFSTDMKWGSGSGNQLVTAVTTNKNEENLLWTVNIYDDVKSFTGNKISCDEIITLKHLSVHESKESGKFQVICEKKKDSPYWSLGENIYLKSVDHNGYVSTSKSYEFNQYNCHNCPILYHLEACIMRYTYPRDEQKWRAKSGVIITPFNDERGEKFNGDEL